MPNRCKVSITSIDVTFGQQEIVLHLIEHPNKHCPLVTRLRLYKPLDRYQLLFVGTDAGIPTDLV